MKGIGSVYIFVVAGLVAGAFYVGSYVSVASYRKNRYWLQDDSYTRDVRSYRVGKLYQANRGSWYGNDDACASRGLRSVQTTNTHLLTTHNDGAGLQRLESEVATLRGMMEDAQEQLVSKLDVLEQQYQNFLDQVDEWR